MTFLRKLGADPAPPDAQIRPWIEWLAKLTTDSVKNLVKVHVETKGGVVRLAGTVPTEADKAEAERLARATDGVKDVTNDLTVSSPSASPSTK